MSSVDIRDLHLSFGSTEVLKNLNLEIAEGEFLVLLGPSGCGKSTLLNCIAGLLDISAGQIFINDRNVTWAEPKDRGIGMVFQSYALYPQMSVEKNLSFGLRVAGLPRAEIESRVARAAGILQIEPLLKRKPAALSGGQRQRVAIGRALVRDVDVFLFDEPLSNLDAKLRTDLRVEIKRLHRRLGNTMIYVTHDQIEALTLADRIAIMKEGIIQQLDSPHGIYHSPQNRFVAGFIGSPGMNFLPGRLSRHSGSWVFSSDQMESSPACRILLDNYDFTDEPREGQRAEFGIRPEHVYLGEAATSLPVQEVFSVELTEPMGADAIAWGSIAGRGFTIRLEAEYLPAPGAELAAGFDPARASLFDEQTGLRL
jgi:multiple sugar transport system ATP-binding protein